MEFKEHIPDGLVLKDRIAANSKAITVAIKKEVGELENEYIRFRRYHRVTVLVIAIAFLLPNLAVFLLGIYLTELPNLIRYIIGIIAALITLSICGYYGGKLLLSGYEVIKRFHATVDKIAFNKVFELLGVEGTLLTHSVLINEKPLDPTASKWIQLMEIIKNHYHSLTVSPEAEAVFDALAHSELITEPFNTTQIDTVFEVTLGGATLHISELDIKQVVGSGRRATSEPIFKGYFASYPLRRTCEGKTFVSTEGDFYGFGHRTYWKGPTGNEVKETIFEWNEFEELLHVATTNEREAREILSPQFMHDLYDWWKKQNTNIRVSFIDNTMYILFFDERIRFEDTVSEINETEITEYLTTIADPLLNILHLVEDVKV